ncbi:MAG: ABC transporter ATP-binding protein [Candidatus Omnitrophica bacterium]|nr:ABC transporter ATP-binding protein [Candidatus Omnitrophota bacterium]
MLYIKNMSFSYGREKILKNLSAEIKDGEFFGIIGPNGSGKTTLLKVMTKILKPSSGSIMLNGKDIKKIPALQYAKSVSFLPSEIEVAFSYAVGEFVAMGRFPYTGRYGNMSAADRKKVMDVLEKFEIGSYGSRKIQELSDGEKQRVFLAQAIVQEPSVIILDEPTSHLDIGHSFRILDIIKDLNRSGITVISVLHDLNLASEYCTRLLMLKNGEIFSQGSPEEVLTYANIEQVYQTKVLVYKNPRSGKPYVFGIPAGLLTGDR